MKKCIVLGIVILVIGVGFTGSTNSSTMSKTKKLSVESKTLYVGGNGSGNYSKIQDAIDNATEGDTIFVFDESSPYHEKIELNKSINLIGENKDTTIIDGSGNNNVIYISDDWINITGFTIQNSDYWGIFLESCNHNTISDNNILDNSYGLFLHHSHSNTITGNFIISNRYYGISLYQFCNKTILSNNNIALYRYSTGCNIIYNNYFDNVINAEDDGYNLWNITKTSGTNIIGGKWLGGNYWSSYTGEDLDGDGLGDTELPHKEQIKNGGDWLPLISHRPSKPIINGPSNGRVGIPYDYTFMSIDFNCNDLIYYILWGDGTTSETSGQSGENVTVSHTWTSQGTFIIKAKARNIHNDESEWGEFTVTITRDKATCIVLFWSLLEYFPLLEKFINIYIGIRI